ncbi:autoinducer binding domain-containing protein [Sphingopyxis sp. FD7]|jgi:transcriptional regulator with XRE-family HTH domain/DNA-binding NarL/FixJ family response regulator|uniref:autoinducer binding domain-containing protein n=1 Tax=Sphingopyxis sp. FD7 TaxID=1914525 RepID=UPI000DC626EF|nr:autoinducer binding domain-containing protein [Sphingopyxis sp. FD7]BBB10996.1 XRE family transcriptional regulator [Sphingopyxis sp. FD7]
MAFSLSLAADRPCPTGFPALLRQHRKRDGRSQMNLALDMGISPRHLGFLEKGRARPSADMVARIADALALAPAERNAMLLAAGFAPTIAPAAAAATAAEAASLALAAFETAVAIAGAGGAAAAVDIAARFLAANGIAHFMTGTLRRGPHGWEVTRDADGRPAIGWLRHNEVNGYRNHDYLIRATAAASAGFFWSDIPPGLLSPLQRRILDEAQDFQIADGFVMPVQMGDGSVRALSAWAGPIDTDLATRTAVTLVATALLDRLARLGTPALPVNDPVRLAAADRDMLAFFAAGYSIDGIGQRLALAEAEVERRLRSIAATMGCASPAMAACRATALKLI